jgi:hypothetical protein
MPGWFNTKELDEFADALVAELKQRFPPPGDKVPRGKGLERLTRSFGVTFARIDTLARSQKLNFYKKAHFANRVRWALAEAGYPKDFVATMTQETLLHLSPPAPPKGKG